MVDPKDLENRMVLGHADPAHRNKWDQAIAVRRKELADIDKRRKQLSNEIRKFRQNRNENVPWPEPPT